MTEVTNIREAILEVLKQNPKMTKYKLAKELYLSTSSHINNYISGKTKKPNDIVVRTLLAKFDIRIKDVE